jgi:hypothetical protein
MTKNANVNEDAEAKEDTAEKMFEDTEHNEAEKTEDKPAEDAEKTEDKPAEDAEKKTLLTGDDSSEAKDEDAKSDESTDKDVPGDYAEFDLPDGLELDQAAIEAFTPLAKELGLTQEQAQALVDLDSERQTRSHNEMQDAIDAMHEGWIDEVKADKELGGANFDESIQTARTFINGYADPELIDVLNETGMGNHPAVVRLFYNLGKSMKEDNVNLGAVRGDQEEVSLAKRMFPDMA